jgi:hypothetical protein
MEWVSAQAPSGGRLIALIDAREQATHHRRVPETTNAIHRRTAELEFEPKFL